MCVKCLTDGELLSERKADFMLAVYSSHPAVCMKVNLFIWLLCANQHSFKEDIMKRFLSIFSDSAKELTNIRCVVMTGMLIALHVLMELLIMIPIGSTMKIAFGFLALASIGMLFGPVPAAIAGAITDILGFLVANKTLGGYHPGFTLVQILTGMIYGIILYKSTVCTSSKIKINGKLCLKFAVSEILVVLICNITLNSYFLKVLYDTAFWALMPARILKNAIQLPIDIFLMIIVLPVVLTAYQNVFGDNAAISHN